MTDLECKKICRLLDIKDIYLNDDGVVAVCTNKNEVGCVYIYEDNFSSALPLRIFKLSSKHYSQKKHLLETLLKQSADGIRCALVGLIDAGGIDTHAFPGKRKLLEANESIESLLVRYDLKFSHKSKKKSRT